MIDHQIKLTARKKMYKNLIPLMVILIYSLSATDDLGLITTLKGNPDCDSTYFGRQCLFLGDINDDGFGDIAISSKIGVDTSNCPFRLYFYWGGPQFDSIPDMILNNSNVGSITNFSQEFGFSIGTQGDVNGDNINDIVISDHLGFHIIYGGNDIDTNLDVFIPETSNVYIDGENHPIQINIRGDIDNDGINDIITTNPHHRTFGNVGTWGNGIIRIYFGGTNIGVPGFVFEGPLAEYANGWSIETCDINGDGYSDLFFGVLDPNYVKIFYGSNNPDYIVDASFSEISGRFVRGNINGDEYTDIISYRHNYGIWAIFGNSVDTLIQVQLGLPYAFIELYDINNDGFDDYILSNPQYLSGFGRIDIIINDQSQSDSISFSIYGQNGGEFGSSTIGVGDINNDGISDLLTGEPDYPIGFDDYGKAYLYSGDTNITVSVSSELPRPPNKISIGNIYPNPFNPLATISFELLEQADITITIYDLMGRDIAVLSDGIHSVGFHNVSWDASNVPSGMYFYQIRAGEFVQTRKMVLLK